MRLFGVVRSFVCRAPTEGGGMFKLEGTIIQCIDWISFELGKEEDAFR